MSYKMVLFNSEITRGYRRARQRSGISSCRRSSRSTKPPAWRRPKNGWTRRRREPWRERNPIAAWNKEHVQWCSIRFRIMNDHDPQMTHMSGIKAGHLFETPKFIMGGSPFSPSATGCVIKRLPYWPISASVDTVPHLETMEKSRWPATASGEFLREALAQQIKDAAQPSLI